MTDIEEEITTEQETEVEETTTYVPPFLRITSTFPTSVGRVESISLELNLRDGDPVGEYDTTSPGDSAAAKSWVLDLVSTTLRELRASALVPAVVVTGSGALREVLAASMRHADDCDGTCGMPAADGPGAAEGKDGE